VGRLRHGAQLRLGRSLLSLPQDFQVQGYERDQSYFIKEAELVSSKGKGKLDYL